MIKKVKKVNLLRLENLTLLSAVAAFGVGHYFPEFSVTIKFLGDFYIKSLKIMILPVVVGSLFMAITHLASERGLKNFGLKILLYYLSTSFLACLVGLLVANIFEPGRGFIAPDFLHYDVTTFQEPTFAHFFSSLFKNPLQSLLDGQMILILLLSLISPMVVSLWAEKYKRPVITFFDSLNHFSMKVVSFIIKLTPIGIFSIFSYFVAQGGMSVLAGVGEFFIVTAVAVFIHAFVILPLVGKLIGKFSPWKFFLNVREALMVSFFTASSVATLPVSKKCLEENEQVNEKTTALVLPLGATINMDGSALYQALMIIFLAHISGLELRLGQQVLVFLLVLLSSAGTAGIPGGGIMMIGMILKTLNLPLELLAIYLVIDRFWDMPVTTVNVWGDLIGAKTLDRFSYKHPEQGH